MRNSIVKKYKSTVAVLLAAVMLTGCNVNVQQRAQSVGDNEDIPKTHDQVPKESEPADKNGDIYIIYTSDVHCGIDKGFGYTGLEQIRETLEKEGYETILVDNGDAVQGEAIGTVTKGEAIIPIMNALHYDVAIPGNHEFDYGMDEFFRFTQMADFPYICCNFTRDGKRVFDPYIIKEAAGKKIAFVGMTTPETLSDVTPETFKDKDGNYVYGFMQGDGSEFYQAVQDAVDSARAEGADYVYALAHLGNDLNSHPFDYMDVVSNTTGIDVFLDGHSHDTDQVVMKNRDGKDVTRSACGTKFEAIGYSHIKADGSGIETGIWTWTNDMSVPELLGIGNDITTVVEDAKKQTDDVLSKVVASSDEDLLIYDPKLSDSNGEPVRIVRRSETNLGDLCADAVRVRTGADIGFVNGGGVRDNIGKGDITYEQIINVHPFGNNNVVIEATGQQIADALEWAVKSLPDEDGIFMQVSGIEFEADPNIPSPCMADEDGIMTGIKGKRRVSDIRVGQEALDPKATYTVAGNDFILIKNGNGLTAFDGAKVVAENAGLDNQMLIDYIVETLGGTIGDDYSDPYGQGRIRIKD